MAINIYVWPKTKTNVGHVAIEITVPNSTLAYREYISFWPDADKVSVTNFYKTFNGQNNNILDDILDEFDSKHTPDFDPKDKIDDIRRNDYEPYLQTTASLHDILIQNSPKVKHHQQAKAQLSMFVKQKFDKLKNENENHYQNMTNEIDSLLKLQGAKKITLYADDSKIKLDEKAMIMQWNQYKRKSLKYNMCGKNCCSMLINILKAGGAQDIVPMPNEDINIWTPKKIGDYAEQIQQTFIELNNKADDHFDFPDKIKNYVVANQDEFPLLKLITPTDYPYTKSVLIESAKNAIKNYLAMNKGSNVEKQRIIYYLNQFNDANLSNTTKLVLLYSLMVTRNIDTNKVAPFIFNEIKSNHIDFKYYQWINYTKIYFINHFHLKNNQDLVKTLNDSIETMIENNFLNVKPSPVVLEKIKLISDEKYLYEKSMDGLINYLRSKVKNQKSCFSFFLYNPMYGKLLNYLEDPNNTLENKKVVLYALLADQQSKIFKNNKNELQSYISKHCGGSEFVYLVKENLKHEFRNKLDHQQNNIDKLNKCIENLLQNVHRRFFRSKEAVVFKPADNIMDAISSNRI